MYICTLEIAFSVHNIHLYLCWQVETTKWILCSRKMVLNSSYLKILVYKDILSWLKIFTQENRIYFSVIGQIIRINKI